MPSRYIYALLDPRDQSVRYVGQTSKALPARLKTHIKDCRTVKNHRACWVKHLVSLDLKPAMFLLEEVPGEFWQEAERFWIAHFAATGARLTNSTNGGDELKVFTPAVRAKMGEAVREAWERPGYRERARESHLGKSPGNKGKKASPELRARLSVANKGRPSPMKGKNHKPEARAKMSVAKRHMSEETRAKMAAAKRGKPGNHAGMKHSAETKAKISATKKAKRASPSQLPLDL